MKAQERLIVALDLKGKDRILALVESLKDAVWFKIGAVNFTAYGPELIGQIKRLGKRVFLDLKFHDIPNTVALAVESACRIGADMLTVHAVGGVDMMRAAVEAARGSGNGDVLVCAVTVLTSMDDENIGRDMLIHMKSHEAVLAFAENAMKAGVNALVASPKEAPLIREHFGDHFRLITPGIRPEGSSAGDQKRITTPADAIALGADFLVVGRPIYASDDPVSAYNQIIRQMEEVC